ncbi:hypothetical protein TRFO_13375 [Tritrichomonas foetus]|uniref:Uncharacterized protein n=1 Tax=Tritrichomonas foetus TaxID=1144522 RepID=A0A1J4L2L5_9EUKA|nr:hypothetical protein TRFO_13375 [Tritrichomonas foetus]|eukprot:OHT16212.1 hypothetical protein TRFO_13375 [Tritrichomonas foetus]
MTSLYLFRTFNGLYFEREFDRENTTIEMAENELKKINGLLDVKVFPILDENSKKNINFNVKKEDKLSLFKTFRFLLKCRFSRNSPMFFEYESAKRFLFLEAIIISDDARFMNSPQPRKQIPKEKLKEMIKIKSFLDENPELFEQVIDTVQNMNNDEFKILTENKDRLKALFENL